MPSADGPLISVVIPVYNGAEFIEHAIRSVQAQTHSNWDLTVCNNRSTDGTEAVAQKLAASDPRIRVFTYPEHVGVVESHNIAVTQISSTAKYCKILGADDWFFPTCLEELVAVAEKHSTVGMVTSYALSGAQVQFDGLPYPSTFMPGRDVCRLRLLENVRVFGGPSSSLIRADIVRTQRPFYAPGNYHGDNEAYLELLKTNDFGFVHQVLSYNRRGEKSRTTSYLDRVGSHVPGYLLELSKYGPSYLTPDEQLERERVMSEDYYGFLAQGALRLRGKEFWHYHAQHMKELGHPLSYARLTFVTIGAIADIVLNPFRLLKAIGRRMGGGIRRMVGTRSKPALPQQTAKQTATE